MSAYVVPFKPATLSEATEDPFHGTAQTVVPAPVQGCTRSECEDSAILFIQLHPYRATVAQGLTAGICSPLRLPFILIGITVQIIGITVQIVGIGVFFVKIDDLEQLFIFIGIRRW